MFYDTILYLFMLCEIHYLSLSLYKLHRMNRLHYFGYNIKCQYFYQSNNINIECPLLMFRIPHLVLMFFILLLESINGSIRSLSTGSDYQYQYKRCCMFIQSYITRIFLTHFQHSQLILIPNSVMI